MSQAWHTVGPQSLVALFSAPLKQSMMEVGQKDLLRRLGGGQAPGYDDFVNHNAYDPGYGHGLLAVSLLLTLPLPLQFILNT